MKYLSQIVFLQIILLCSISAAANTRLAIGSFGLSSEKLDGELADLIAVRLSTKPKLELVERRELNTILKEAGLSFAGLLKPKDAVRVGALLRVDQFLLGTAVAINGTNRCIVRLVDARSGAIRAINVFPASQSLHSLAGEIAAFASTEFDRPAREQRDYLAIGVIQNLGVNNRFRDFPAQMRGSLAANLSEKVTVLERDVVSFLATEVRLNLAGLTESQNTNAQFQFAFWIVDGFYQSHEIAKPEVHLKLRVERVQGRAKSFWLQGEPNEQFFLKISETIEQALKLPEGIAGAMPPTRKGEIAALEARADQLVQFVRRTAMPRDIRVLTAQNPDKLWSTLDEAIRLYESILLLDPDNASAKMRLAACLLFDTNPLANIRLDFPPEKAARANELYAEVVTSGDPEYAVEAQIWLGVIRGGLDGVRMLRRFSNETSDPKAREQLRYYASELLQEWQYRLPVEDIVADLRAKFFDELKDLEGKTGEPFIVNFEGGLFAYRFYPERRNQAMNAVLPDLLEHFPKLKPYILLAAVGEQTASDSPVVAQFLASLKECEEHPETLLQPSSYFTHLSTTLDDEKAARSGWVYANVYERTFEHGQHSAVIAMALARQRAAEKGLAPPLTKTGQRLLAQSYGSVGEWQKALEIYVTLPDTSPQVINECRRHLGQELAAETVPDSAWKDKTDIEKVNIAYECIGREQWLTAAAILDSMGHRTVRMNRGGPWGRAFAPFLPALRANRCRVQAGKPAVQDPMVFDLGKTPYIQFRRDGPRFFAFEAEGDDVWVATYSQIKRFSGAGPFEASKPVELHEVERFTSGNATSICVSRNVIWMGTEDDGLFELDRRTGQIRQTTMKNGLFVDGISDLRLQDKTLWIAYQRSDEGAIGTMDLQTRKFSAMTPNLQLKTETDTQADIDRLNQPPEQPISCMTESAPGEMWFGVVGKGMQSYRLSDSRWKYIFDTFPRTTYLSSIAADAANGRLLVAARDSGILDNEKSTSGGLYIYDYRQHKHTKMRIEQGLPANDLTAVAVDGNIAWIGGRGFVAVINTEQRKVLRIAYISANCIKRIQLGKTFVWIQVNAGGDDYGSKYAGEAWTGIYRLERAAIESTKN